MVLLDALRRIALMIPVIFMVTAFTFALVHIIPGDVIVSLLGVDAPREQVEALREGLGLNDALPVRYVKWMGRILRGDFGNTATEGLPVLHMIKLALPATVQLAVMAQIFALVIAVPAGVLAAMYRNSIWDMGANIVALTGLATPNFWLGIMLILLFALKLGWLPALGYVSFFDDPLRNLKLMTLPAITLGTGLTALIMRQTRSAMLEVLTQDYVRTAWAKGLGQKTIIARHALKNAAIPVITVFGFNLASLLSGAFIIENIFVLPGMGKLGVEAIFTHDVVLIQGVVLLTALWVLLVNLTVDILYAWLDPRIRFG